MSTKNQNKHTDMTPRELIRWLLSLPDEALDAPMGVRDHYGNFIAYEVYNIEDEVVFDLSIKRQFDGGPVTAAVLMPFLDIGPEPD